MSGPLPRSVPSQPAPPPPAADVVEQAVRKVTQLVLGAQALADRLERLAAAHPVDEDRARRIALLRSVVEQGRRSLARVVVDDTAAAVLQAPAPLGDTRTPSGSRR